MDPQDHLRIERRDSALVVHFLDRKIYAELAIAALGEELYLVARRPDCLKLVLSFAEVEFFSSAMFGKLIVMKKMLAERGGAFRLCEICPNLRTMFRLTALDQILDIRATEAEAVGP